MIEIMLAEWVFEQYFTITKCYYIYTHNVWWIYLYLQSIFMSKLTCYGQAHKYCEQ